MRPVNVPTITPPCPLCDDDAAPFSSEHGHALHRCAECELIFVHPQPTPEELREMYESRTEDANAGDYYRDYLEQEPGLRQHARHLLGWFGAPPRDGRLLEIGCGAGFFLAEARRFGWSVEGIEPNRIFVEHGRELLHIDVAQGRLEDAILEPESCHAVVMLDLMSHLHDPALSLAHVADCLAPGGRLLIQGGLRGECTRKPRDEDWETPFHLFHYGSRAFHRLLDLAGLEVVEERREVKVPIPSALQDPRLRWLKELARPALPLLRRVLARRPRPQSHTHLDWTYYVIARRR